MKLLTNTKTNERSESRISLLLWDRIVLALSRKLMLHSRWVLSLSVFRDHSRSELMSERSWKVIGSSVERWLTPTRFNVLFWFYGIRASWVIAIAWEFQRFWELFAQVSKTTTKVFLRCSLGQAACLTPTIENLVFWITLDLWNASAQFIN